MTINKNVTAGNMMKQFNLVMDILPSTFSSVGDQDYCARQIFPLIHESLLSKSSGKIDCNYFIDSFSINGYYVEIKFNNSGKWNTGQIIEPEHYRLSACLQDNTKSDFVDCFDFIERDKDGNLQIFASPTTLKIRIKYIPENIEEYFASSVWLPVLSKNDVETPSYSGRYYLDELHNERFTLKSSFGYPNLNFIIIKDLNIPLDLYVSGEIHFTCPTYFPYNRVAEFSKHPDFIDEHSDIQFILDINYDNLTLYNNKQIKERLLSVINPKKIQNDLYGGCTAWPHFSCLNHSEHIQSKSHLSGYINDTLDTSLYDTIEIMFSDFYPNENVVDTVSSQLVKSKLCNRVVKRKLSFEGLYEAIENGDYEVALLLELPTVKNRYQIYSSYRKYILDNAIEEYDHILNKINSHLAVEDVNDLYNDLESILKAELPFIPILNGKHLYLKSPNIDFLHLDQDGRLLYK